MNCQHLRVVFAGTPDFAVPALGALIESSHRIVAVYSQPDRPAGRGRKLLQSPVKQFALEHSIAVYQPQSLRDKDAQEELRALQADVMVVAAYGLLLPVAVLDIPPLGCVNIHASLLPRWRGAAPIQRAIEAGDGQSGVTIMQMAKGLDTGDMLLKLAAPIGENTTAQELHNKLADLGSQGLLEVLPRLCAGEIHPAPQDESQACYATKIDKQDAGIDWSMPALDIHRRICAFNPFPIAFTRLGDKTLRIWLSRLCEGTATASPGTVVFAEQGEIRVATGDGLVCLLELQLPGKKPLCAREFLNGRKLLGETLG